MYYRAIPILRICYTRTIDFPLYANIHLGPRLPSIHVYEREVDMFQGYMPLLSGILYLCHQILPGGKLKPYFLSPLDLKGPQREAINSLKDLFLNSYHVNNLKCLTTQPHSQQKWSVGDLN